MKVTLVDKSYQFRPLDFTKTILAKFEIEFKDEEELQDVLMHINALDPLTLHKPKSGVVKPPTEPPKLHLKIEKKDEVVEEEPFSTMGPISSLEIE